MACENIVNNTNGLCILLMAFERDAISSHKNFNGKLRTLILSIAAVQIFQKFISENV
jgi:hypothetical protein